MKVVLLQRRPWPGQFSFEGYFERVISGLRALKVDCELRIVPWRSGGLARRLLILAHAALNQGEVTHITGDITFAALATRGRSTIVTIHDCEILERTRGLKRSVIRLFWFTLPVRRAALVTVVSQATKDRLLELAPGLEASKVHVVPVCVSDRFTADPPRPMPDKPRVLQIGAKPNKNLPRLVEALSGLDCRLTIVGHVDEALASQLAASGLDYEVRTGVPEAELVELYRQADVVAFVSTYEGFGMPIVEAQSVGRPVITADRTSMPEVAGPGACLVDPYDVAAIRAAFARVFADAGYRAELVARGLENVARFRTAAISRRYADLYESLTTKPGTP